MAPVAHVAGLAENAPHGCHGKRAWLREMNSWRLCPGLTGNSNMSAWKCAISFFCRNSDDQRENFWMFPPKQRQRLLAFRISHVSPEQRKCRSWCDEMRRDATRFRALLKKCVSDRVGPGDEGYGYRYKWAVFKTLLIDDYRELLQLLTIDWGWSKGILMHGLQNMVWLWENCGIITITSILNLWCTSGWRSEDSFVDCSVDLSDIQV